MTRQDALGEAILREPHPVYGKLTYGRFSRIQNLTRELPEGDSALANGIAWVICTRDKSDPELVAALAASDPREALRDIFEEGMHATEAQPFLAWFNAEIGAVDAASTTAKEDTSPGK